MDSALKDLPELLGRDVCANTSVETETRGAARQSFGPTIFRYGLALGSVAAATVLGFLADRLDLHQYCSCFRLPKLSSVK